MRVHLLSDLHLELAITRLPRTEADVVVLAGDVQLGSKGISWIRRRFAGRHVVYVLGNHEFYHHSIPELSDDLRRKTAGSPVHVLEDHSVQIGGYTFVGCTLWSDFRLLGDPEIAMMAAERGVCDFSLIEMKAEKRVFRPQDAARLHSESVAWLKTELSKVDPNRTIAVTHHAPSPRSIPAPYADDPLSAAFASDLDPFIESSGIPLWIHGHTHFNVDYTVGSTRILTNQCGYPGERVAGFDAGLVVEL